MRLVFLGTSAAQPTAERGLSCTCLERDGEIIMFDAGEGAQRAFTKAGLGWNKKMKILVTHMHGDHCVGLLGMLQTMSMQDRSEPLEICGPPGIDEFLRANMRMLGLNPPFSITISTTTEGEVFSEKGYAIRACKADHSTTAFSYRVDERDRPGRFDRARAQELGVPEGPMWRQLQDGKDVELEGRTVRPSQVLGEPRPGKSVGISGDTRPSERLAGFFAGCGTLVFDSTFLDEMKPKAVDTGHSTAAEAGRLAAEAGAGRLVLTHFSARYPDAAPLLEEARRHHGNVVAARDQLAVDL